MKVTVGTEDGKTHQIEVDDNSQITGKKVGEDVDGSIFGLPGYTLKITGGTDRDGFPMRKSIDGTARRRILLEKGSGIREDEKGVRRKRSVRGNTVSEEIEQLNTQVAESGTKSVEDLLSKDEE